MCVSVICWYNNKLFECNTLHCLYKTKTCMCHEEHIETYLGTWPWPMGKHVHRKVFRNVFCKLPARALPKVLVPECEVALRLDVFYGRCLHHCCWSCISISICEYRRFLTSKLFVASSPAAGALRNNNARFGGHNISFPWPPAPPQVLCSLATKMFVDSMSIA